MTKWELLETDADIALMSQVLSIDRVTARILANRNIRTKNNAIKFLRPEERYMYDPSEMKDMDRAVELVSKCAVSGGKIVIYGDYDVDGVMSTAILYKTLRKLGTRADYYIPNREEEGYGLNIEAVRSIKADGADMILACDNGISAIDEVLEAKKLGMTIVIIDHHEPGFIETSNEEGGEHSRADVLPEADAIVDTKQTLCRYPYKQLCAGGLAFKFAQAFYKHNNIDNDEKDDYLILAAIATVCDIVDLQDENRIIVKNGLELLNKKLINKTAPPGLTALLAEKGYQGRKIGETEAGYIIGPCINATGRLGNASLSVELFVTDDPIRIAELSKKLAAMNDERKLMTAKSVERVMAKLTESVNDDNVIVIYDEDIHESIAGIVAGKVKDELSRPVIVLTGGIDCAKGSARSIEGYNIFEELYKHRELFRRFGGHAMAAGLSLDADNIPILRRRLNESCTLKQEDFVKTIWIDDEPDFCMITEKLAIELEQLAPFGKGNHAPLFRAVNLRVVELRNIAEKNTMIFLLSDGEGRRIKGIAFGLNDKFKADISKKYSENDCGKILKGFLYDIEIQIDIIYAIEINCYNGTSSVQLRIKDLKMKVPDEVSGANDVSVFAKGENTEGVLKWI